ncbi:MAG: molecular chaperone TorD family protein [bacterium]
MQYLQNSKTLKNFLPFADLFDYPYDKELISSILSQKEKIDDKELQEIFKEFEYILNTEGISKLQELYSSAFDIMPIFYPYLSYHLYYDSFDRNSMMIQLREFYKQNNFSYDVERNELPDHLFIMLKFLQKNSQYLDVMLDKYFYKAFENFANGAKETLKNPTNIYLKLLKYILNQLVGGEIK